MIGIDEFSAIGSDHVAALLSRGRESGMPVFVATQELADLERAARGLEDLVLGVTAVKIIHRQEVPSSALTIAQIAGTEEVWEETRQIGGRLLGGYGTGRGTRRLGERYIVHPNEIKTLRTGEAVVISKIRGARPRTVRINPPPRRRTRALIYARAGNTMNAAPGRTRALIRARVLAQRAPVYAAAGVTR